MLVLEMITIIIIQSVNKRLNTWQIPTNNIHFSRHNNVSMAIPTTTASHKTFMTMNMITYSLSINFTNSNELHNK